MFALSVPVQAGDTLSQIAASHGVSLGAVEAANHFANPNLITVGETVAIPSGGSLTQWTPTASSSPSPSASSGQSSSSGSSAGGSSIDSIPGVPSSFVSCVAFRESTNGTNQAFNGGVYGIITASGINVNGQSLAAQKAAFKQIYDTTGPSAWAADGCPGT
jgi:hypothetical protein